VVRRGNAALSRFVVFPFRTRDCSLHLTKNSKHTFYNNNNIYILIFIYFCMCSSDHTEIPPPPDKVAPPLKTLLQEEVGSEACQSLGGLSEVPPPSAPCSCCQASPEQPGEPREPGERRTMTTRLNAPPCVTGLMLLFIVLLFILTALYSG